MSGISHSSDNSQMAPIRSFRELRVYQVAFANALEIFKISKQWPIEERFNLTDQIRRSSRAVCGATAEAWRNRQYPAAFVNKLNQAETEATETQVWLDFALASEYIDGQQFERLDTTCHSICRQLTAMREDPESWRPPLGKQQPPRNRRKAVE
jgi:four helix bundle protein